MTRWLLTVEYDGTGFAGWQRQRNALSVQQVLEEAFYRLSGEAVTLAVAGRTDAGVHARGQIAAANLLRPTRPHLLRAGLNALTRPHPVAVLSCRIVGDDFDPRRQAIRRHYAYRIIRRSAPLILERGRAWQIHRTLDVPAMQDAAALLLGRHDFSTFRAAGCQASGPVRTLETARFTEDGDSLWFITSARSFLYHQVRNMVGTLVQVGLGKWSRADFAAALAAADRTRGGPTAPAEGLYLQAIDYHASFTD